MSHIVLLSSYYLGKASTNGLCAQNLVKALSDIGHDVDVVCYEDKDVNDETVYTIKENYQSPKGLFIHTIERIKRIANIVLCNSNSFLINEKVKHYYEMLSKINCKKKIDVVVAMFFPMETAAALTQFKKINPDVKAIVYELDSILDGVAQNDSYHKFLKFSYLKWLTSVYKTVDDVIIMKSHLNNWLAYFGDKFNYKSHESDLPVLLQRVLHEGTDANITFIYAGLLDKKYRSPEYLLEVLKELEKEINFNFYFYSKGDCEEMIAEKAKKMQSIKQLGYVEQDVLDTAIYNASFLVSIGNRVSNSIPSKLISYISFKKPIIHLSCQEDDICGHYLAKYPLALIINQDNSVEESCRQILSFMEEIKTIDDNINIDDLFLMNTPQYSASLIDSIVLKSKDTNRR